MFYRINGIAVVSNLRQPVQMDLRIYYSTAAQIYQLSQLAKLHEVSSIQAASDGSTNYYVPGNSAPQFINVPRDTEILHVSDKEYWYTGKVHLSDIEVVGARQSVAELVEYHKLTRLVCLDYECEVVMEDIARVHHWRGQAHNVGHAEYLAKSSAMQVFPGNVKSIQTEVCDDIKF